MYAVCSDLAVSILRTYAVSANVISTKTDIYAAPNRWKYASRGKTEYTFRNSKDSDRPLQYKCDFFIKSIRPPIASIDFKTNNYNIIMRSIIVLGLTCSLCAESWRSHFPMSRLIKLN